LLRIFTSNAPVNTAILARHTPCNLFNRENNSLLINRLKKENAMHDIDRTLAEFEPEMGAYETGQEEYEFQDEYEFEGSDTEAVFDEMEEMELAAELLGVTDEAELDQFLGKLFKKVGGAVGKFVKSPVGRTLGKVLKGVAKKALPVVGGALGSFVPGVGTAIGTTLGKAASNLFEVELEGLSPEDQEFEVARRFVQLAGAAAKNAALAPPTANPQAAAKMALTAAAKKHAPGLLRGGAASSSTAAAGRGRSGRWIRRGRKIVLLGV
jgi:uncharacterized protein (DUF697 family)